MVFRVVLVTGHSHPVGAHSVVSTKIQATGDVS